MCRNGSACGCGGKSGGVPVVLIMAALVVGGLVVFVAAHAGILARAAVSFVSIMSIVIWLIWRSARLPNRRPANPRPVRDKITQGAGQPQQAIRRNGVVMITGRRRLLRLEAPETITAGLDLPGRPEAAPASPAEAIARQPQTVAAEVLARAEGETMPR